jgi:hypothetical protein
MWNERHVQVLNGDVLIVTRLDRLVRSTRDLLNVIAALADRVRHARGRSPEDQEAGGRPGRMIFRSRNRRCHRGSTEQTSLQEHYPNQVESPCLAPKSIRKLSADERAFLNWLDCLNEEEIKRLTTREIFAYFKIIDKVDSRAVEARSESTSRAAPGDVPYSFAQTRTPPEQKGGVSDPSRDS